jgi:hypothetical protein
VKNAINDVDGYHLYFAETRQVSLAGGAGGSQEKGAKALDMLFCQQALCLSGGRSN